MILVRPLRINAQMYVRKLTVKSNHLYWIYSTHEKKNQSFKNDV